MQQLLKQILDKTFTISARYDELCVLVSSPEIIAHNSYWRKLVQEQNDIEEVALAHNTLSQYLKELDNLKAMLSQNETEEYKSILLDEIALLENKIATLTEKVKEILLPINTADNKNVILEIRYVEGGENGAFFCIELLNMYERFTKQENFSFEIVEIAYCQNGGARYVGAIISGKDAYSRLKHESGIHKAIGNISPLSRGRASSSICTVAILPEIEEIEVNLDESDLRIDTFHSSGAGGQNVNKLDTAIRITHIPSGIVVNCQDERSQLKNKERAMKLLRSKLYHIYKRHQEQERSQNRKDLIYNTNKTQVIRTYNYSLCKVTDHRIDESTNLNYVLDGRLDTFIDAVNIKENDNTLNML